jgi:hypothetical protein
MEFKFKGKEYFQKLGFNSIDIVFGGDHGARRIHAMIKLIIWNKEDTLVSPKRLNDAIKESIATIKTLNAKQKDLLTALNENETALDVAKKNESAVKEKFGKQGGREVLRLVERVLTNHCISKPYYHGGKYNGKAMDKFMTNSQEIMDDLSTML